MHTIKPYSSGTSCPNRSLICSNITKVRTVWGPRRTNAGTKPCKNNKINTKNWYWVLVCQINTKITMDPSIDKGHLIIFRMRMKVKGLGLQVEKREFSMEWHVTRHSVILSDTWVTPCQVQRTEAEDAGGQVNAPGVFILKYYLYIHLLVSYHDGLRTQIPCALALGY